MKLRELMKDSTSINVLKTLRVIEEKNNGDSITQQRLEDELGARIPKSLRRLSEAGLILDDDNSQRVASSAKGKKFVKLLDEMIGLLKNNKKKRIVVEFD